MADVKTLARERTQLFKDLFDGKIPKRVPISVNFPLEFSIQYAGEDLAESQWDTSMLEGIFEKVCENFVSDILPVQALRFPLYYTILGARNFVMSSSGFLQHPEISGLEAEEYDEFIESPYNCIMEKILPRIYTELNTNPVQRSLVMAKAFKAFYDEVNNVTALYEKLIKKYGYSSAGNTNGFVEAPFDFMSDQLRGFRGITGDIRRRADKVAAACEAVTPIMVKGGIPASPSKYGGTFIPLHMAPYIRTKDFEKLYWPSFKREVEELAAAGQPSLLFVENDWTRYVDYLYELPENTRMWFEYGDPKFIKEKLGKKHILTGFYPISILKTGTKQQCIDKAKELVDILAPGGKYMFGFDKAIITADSVKIENLQAVLEYVAENTDY
ncbi:uroporphyrinogen decarboxylase family protein [Clostridium sp. MT-14]|uniref:Uroporphyrinogen decarboxylase n=1 Tax=Clostridium aromativorans TaxID=2836848 RepID=A0ABS8N9E7_9CLOT|nr:MULTISPECIES: uroporphyrinogen decarboxylase family protein [Clostridium]KAA8667219.1 uroporphyrinogen decarboxylase [Clostridium sp. HV4-5-A1G]MCC9296460.1 uroporphyrinogen decarboxylase [Clostridium aromativorans]CAB1239469.1 Uroporphyrinogen decarboxylase [Clostridiaceae bacterium BL-3]